MPVCKLKWKKKGGTDGHPPALGRRTAIPYIQPASPFHSRTPLSPERHSRLYIHPSRGNRQGSLSEFLKEDSYNEHKGPDQGGKQGAEEAVPALALPAHGRVAASPARGAADQGGEQGAEEAAPALALPANGRGPKEKGMAHAALRTHRDAGHGGDEEGARAGRARPVGMGELVVE